MPRNKYPGRNKRDLYPNVIRTEVSFKDICEHGLIPKLKKPPHQGGLQDEKINGMIEEYMSNPSYWGHKQIIVIGELNGNYFITDGQHRLEAAEKLYKEHNKNDTLLFNWNIVNNEDELRGLYHSVNHDSAKNSLYIEQELMVQCRSESFVDFFKENYRPLFPNKMSAAGKRYPIEIFRDELTKRNFFDRERHSRDGIFSDMKPSESYHEYILRSNAEFYERYDYDKYVRERQLDNLFYKDEINFIAHDRLVFMFKNCNFLDWIMNKSTEPSHKTKRTRESIPRSIRDKVWKSEFGTNEQGMCPIPHCETVLEWKKKDSWHAGHKKSHMNGGELKLENLRPICWSCNLDMGGTNWDDYVARINSFETNN